MSSLKIFLGLPSLFIDGVKKLSVDSVDGVKKLSVDSPDGEFATATLNVLEKTPKNSRLPLALGFWAEGNHKKAHLLRGFSAASPVCVFGTDASTGPVWK